MLALVPAASAGAQAPKPFRPKVTAEVTDASRKAGSRPGVRVTITKPVSDDALFASDITLPAQLRPNVTLLQHVCTPPQLKAKACPPSTRIGTAEAVTPLTKSPLTGGVYFANTGTPAPDAPGLELPYTSVFLTSGALSIRLDGALRLAAGGGLQSVFSNLPPTPLSRFSLTFFGGKGGTGGNFTAATDLCSSKRGRLNVHLTSAGKVTVNSRVPLVVPACSREPLVSATASGLAGRTPRLDLLVRRGPRSARLSTVRFELPRGLSLRRGALGDGAVAVADGRHLRAGAVTALDARTVQVRGLGSRGAMRMQLRLRGRALVATDALRARARRLQVSRLSRPNPLALPAVVRAGRLDGRRSAIALKVTGRA
jgi:hypothetical protein